MIKSKYIKENSFKQITINKMKNTYYIAVDFDGTCVTHEFPNIGSDIGAVHVLKALVNNGHKIILNTMRSDKDAGGTNVLQDAVNWFKNNGVELFGINNNPTQSKWTSSPKPFAHMYIDDAALGCPLMFNKHICDRPFVDWLTVAEMLLYNNLISKEDYEACTNKIRALFE